jgi:UDP-N-acetylmuramate--L-alanine ligase (EC 6.3.2.8)
MCEGFVKKLELMRISPQSSGIIHFVGIGGIGMSGIAEILHTLGYPVRGSDLSENSNVIRLRALGIPVVTEQCAENVEGASVIVVSSAIQAGHSELTAARRLKLPVVRRAEMLAEIMRLRPSIAVAGTHGKTTTTSLGACVLQAGGLDPTIISGGIINSLGTNARLGTGAWTIVEADESDGSFIKLPATIAIVTNIDPDHMDYYKDYEHLQESFRTYIENIPFYGLAILCADHVITLALAKQIQDRRVVTYGFSEKADLRAINVRLEGGGSRFDLVLNEHADLTFTQKIPSDKLQDFYLPMLGEHNILNALAVVACALELGMDPIKIKQGLSEFQGVKRRFTALGEVDGVLFVDDYAHHPTEIEATLKSARQLARGSVIAVAQPHRYSRLTALFSDFAECFDAADQIIVTPVYAAGEDGMGKATHHDLVEALKKRGKVVYSVENEPQVAELIDQIGTPGDLCVFMGAGSITGWCARIYETLTLQLQALEQQAPIQQVNVGR